MTAQIVSLWRHPIKAVGREAVERVTLAPGQTLAGDRLWAVAHDASKAEDGAWTRCAAFIRAASSPSLMAVSLRTDGDRLHLSHPDRPPLDIDPARDNAALIDWLMPLVASGRAEPARLVRAPADRGMTDSDEPSISLASVASHGAVEERAGKSLSRHRWRCNIWVDGLAPWEEFDWVGRTIRIGEAELRAEARISRCMATTANPETGERDVPVLAVLDQFGHQDFSVALVVTRGGDIAVGDVVEAVA